MDLTPKEFSLLAFFLVHAESVVTRTELLEKVWDFNFDPGSNVVDVHVARLRAKLRRYGATARLATVRGAGFMLTARGEDGDDA
jgi:DNA-binding response OmpR family regulator